MGIRLSGRATTDIHIESQGKQVVIPEGDLIQIHIYATNVDESVVGEQPPTLNWNELTTGYEVRDFLVALD